MLILDAQHEADWPRFACILTGGDEFNIRVRGKMFHFEWHPYSGPIALTKRGDEAASQPGYFLEAASLWHQQGMRMTPDGYCVWKPKTVAITEHLGGRHYLWIRDEIQADCS